MSTNITARNEVISQVVTVNDTFLSLKNSHEL